MKLFILILLIIFSVVLTGYFTSIRSSGGVHYKSVSLGLSCADGVEDGKKKIFKKVNKNHGYGVKEKECVDLDYYTDDMTPLNVELFRFKDDPDGMCVATKFSKEDVEKINKATAKVGRNRYVMSIDGEPYAMSYLNGGVTGVYEICSSVSRAYEIRNDFLLNEVNLRN